MQRSRSCANCGATLSGEFCGRCGQRERESDVGLNDLLLEALEDFGRLDGRMWRTLLRLVLQPGRVTADYLRGRRARYLPPVRLYLVVSFLVFLLINLAPLDVTLTTDPGVDIDALRSERGAGIYVPVERESGETEVLSLQEFFREQAGEEGLQPAWLNALIERMIRNASLVDADAETFKAQLLQRLPQMMFFLLPLFALILWLAYIMSPYHYLQHLIFSLHFHTAAFIYFILLYPARWLLPGDFGGLVMLALLVYLPIALARTYGSRPLAAVGKSVGVGLVYYLLVLTGAVIYVFVNLALVEPT